MDSKYIVGVITIAVTAMLVGSVLIPVIDSTNTGTTIVYEDNPDWDGWIRFDLNRSAGAAYEISITQDENGIYVGAGTDVQAYDDSSTGEYATIFYADSNTVVWADDGDAYKIMGMSNGSPVYFTTSDDLTISRDSNGVSVSDGVNSYAFDTPAWAYIPKSTGTYGFYPYDAERGVSVSDDPAAVVGGGFAGVYAYNDVIRYGLDLTMVPIVADGVYYGATWEIPAADLSGIQITPLDPSVIGGGSAGTNPVTPIDIDDPFDDPDAGIMTVPTPTYTDGDWGYDLKTVDGVDKAVIVSYSGAGGNIVVPATVGGYDVYQIGKGTSSTGYEVFDYTTLADNSTLTLPEGVVIIGTGAFQMRNGSDNESKFTGNLTIPSTVKEINRNAFSYTKFTGSLVLPDNLVKINQGAFGNSYFDSIVFNGGETIQINTINSSPFLKNIIYSKDFSSISDTTASIFTTQLTDIEFLNLTDREITPGLYGLVATATVSDSIGDSFGFLASSQIAHEEPGGDGPYSFLFAAIPAILLISLLVIAAGFVIARRDY